MNQIAGVDGFNLMNNLRLVIIVAIFIGIIIALFLNWILGAWRRVKREDMQAVNPSDDSSREERHAPVAVDDLFGMEESTEKEISKGGESTAESEVEIEDQPVVNYEKMEADLEAVRDEVTTKIEADLKVVRDEVTAKIEGLILKVEAVEKAFLNKIEDVIDVKIQEASNKINDSLTEVLRTQINLINPVSEERVDSLRKEEVPADILPSEDTVVPEEIKEKEQTDTIAPSGEIEEKISAGDVGESVGPARIFFQKFLSVGIPSTEEYNKDSDILEKLRLVVKKQLDAFGILPSHESKTVAEEKKEGDLEVPSEVKKDVKVDEKEPIEAIASIGGELWEKISEGDVGESVDFDIQKLLEEEPVGMPSTEEPKELVEEKVEFEEKKERDLEAPVEDNDIVEKLAGSLQMDEDPFDILPSEDTVVPEEIKEKEQTDTIAPSGEIEEKKSEGDVGESVDFDIQKLLEEEPVGISFTEESREVVEEKVKFKKEKERDLKLPTEKTIAHEGIDEKEIDTTPPSGDIKEKALETAKGEEAEDKKQPTGKTVDFDIQAFLEELGTLPSEKG